MSKALSVAELEAEQVELLPSRTVMCGLMGGGGAPGPMVMGGNGGAGGAGGIAINALNINVLSPGSSSGASANGGAGGAGGAVGISL